MVWLVRTCFSAHFELFGGRASAFTTICVRAVYERVFFMCDLPAAVNKRYDKNEHQINRSLDCEHKNAQTTGVRPQAKTSEPEKERRNRRLKRKDRRTIIISERKKAQIRKMVTAFEPNEFESQLNMNWAGWVNKHKTNLIHRRIR